MNAIPFQDFDPEALKQLPLEKQVMIFAGGTRALHEFVEEQIYPIISTQLAQSRWEQALSATYYRMCLIVRSVVKLDDPCHFQLAAMAARSIFELLLDMKVLARDPTFADMFFDFVDVDKFEKATKLRDFLASHPQIDSTQHRAEVHFADDAARKQRIEQLCVKHWGTTAKGKPRCPKHWSGVNDIIDRARDAGLEYEEFYLFEYGIQSYHVHAGAGGILNLSRDDFQRYFAITHWAIWRLFREATEIVCEAFHVFQARPELRDELKRATIAGAAATIEQLIKQDAAETGMGM